MNVYVFKSLPPFLWGYTRDMRAMWALEECRIPYRKHCEAQPAFMKVLDAYEDRLGIPRGHAR